MSYARDLMGIGVPAEEAIRVGDIGPQYLTGLGGSALSTATTIGGPNGATVLELNVTTVSVGAVVFLSTTELDRPYTIYNSSSNGGYVYPASTGSFNGLGIATAFNLPANKVAFVSRLGPIPPGSTSTLTQGTIASDRWIYTVSN